MNARHELNKVRARRVIRVRAKLQGRADMPRLAVFRSNKGFSAQLIDDEAGKTLASVSSKDLKDKKVKSDQAEALGEMIAKKAKAAGIEKAIFDRRGYAYHGRVQRFAEGARKGGLKI
jgi:large subunit ribosomal protein L18